jgi:hypothetical protein
VEKQLKQKFDTDKDYELLHDRSVISTKKMSHDKKKKSNCVDHNQNLVMSPKGAQRKDGQTD